MVNAKRYFLVRHWIQILIEVKTHASTNSIMSYLPKTSPSLERDVSMNGVTMIISLLNDDMRLGTMKQSYAKNFIAQEKKQNSFSRAIKWCLLVMIYFLLVFLIQWVWKDINQSSGINLKRKDWQSTSLLKWRWMQYVQNLF